MASRFGRGRAVDEASVVDAEDDAALIARAKRDPRAFEPLYRRYAEPVYRYAYRRLGDHDAAADATSLVFTRVLAALPAYREGDGTFRSWLFRIAHNVITDHFRARPPNLPLADVHVRDTDPSPEEIVIAAEEGDLLSALLARLTDNQRHVLELRRAELSGEEIAAALGCSHAAVRMLQHRAIERLRQIRDELDSPTSGVSHDRR
jgi:RNA polymerase sigma-70 factor (ECF subfamily)